MMNDTQTQPDFTRLIELLQEEFAIYQSLLRELRAKQKAIVAGNVPGLRDIISSEQVIIQKTMNISRKRNEQVRNLMRGHGLKGELTLMGVIELAGPVDRYRLITLRDQLKLEVENIQLINKENRYLLNSSIDFIHGLVNIFLNTSHTPAGIYNTSGSMSGSDGTNKMFDYQI